MTEQKPKKDNVTTSSLVLGLLSVFLWEFSVIPILAIIFGAIGLARGKRKWEAGIGVALGVIFLIVRISQGHIDRGFLNTPSSDATQQTSAATATLPISALVTSTDSKENLSTGNVKSSSDSVSSVLSLENQTKMLGLTSPLYEKYSFLDKAIGLSLPLFESIYQKQQSSIANLQHLQSIEYRSDVAQVLTVVQGESAKLLKVIAGVKDIQGQQEQGMEQLVNANKTIGSKSIEEYFIKFVNDETRKVDEYIYMFNPKNPDNVGSVIYARDMKTTELQEALFRSIQSTR